MRAGNLDEAERNFRKAIQKAPTFIAVRNNLIALLIQKKQINQSLEELRIALELAPNNADLWQLCGDAFMQISDCENAVFAYNKSVEINPLNIAGILGKANCYEMLHHPNLAEQYYKHALNILEPQKSLGRMGFFATHINIAYLHLSYIYKEQNRIVEQINCLEQCLVFKPDDFIAMESLKQARQNLK